jgi:hypothetical protein
LQKTAGHRGVTIAAGPLQFAEQPFGSVADETKIKVARPRRFELLTSVPSLTQRRHPGASPQRERKRVLKMLFDETALKSPIFYSEDFAIDGAAMPKKLCAMQWKSSSQRM